jgi:hypothetical protein
MAKNNYLKPNKIRLVGWVVHFEQENVFFWGYILYFFGGRFFFISYNIYKTHKIKFLFQNVLFVTTIFDHHSVFSPGTRSNINYKEHHMKV